MSTSGGGGGGAGGVIALTMSPAEWDALTALTNAAGSVRRYEPEPEPDQMNAHRLLLCVHAHYAFRALPKALRKEILEYIGETK